MHLLHVGHGAFVAEQHILAITPPLSLPIRARVQAFRKARPEAIIDATAGRRTRAVIFLSDGRLVLSAVTPTGLSKRWRQLLPDDDEPVVGLYTHGDSRD